MGIRKKILLAIAKQSQPQKFPIGQYYPNIFKTWEQNYLNIFQQIVNITNLALFYLSETQLSFLELKQNNFSINPNEYSFNNLPKIIAFSKFLNQLLNSNNLIPIIQILTLIQQQYHQILSKLMYVSYDALYHHLHFYHLQVNQIILNNVQFYSQ